MKISPFERTRFIYKKLLIFFTKYHFLLFQNGCTGDFRRFCIYVPSLQYRLKTIRNFLKFIFVREKIQKQLFACIRLNKPRETFSWFHLIIMFAFSRPRRVFSRTLRPSGENSLQLSEYSSICESRLRNLLPSGPNFPSIANGIADGEKFLLKSVSDIEFEK